MRRTITPHLAEKAFSLIGPFMKEKKNSGGFFQWEAIEYYHMSYYILQKSFSTVHNLSHWRCFQAKNYKT